MKIKILSSGSKGNSTYIETENKKILIDMGVTYQYLATALDEINITPKDLDLILITHTHNDHIKGLQSLVRKTNLEVYVTAGMIPDLVNKIPAENINIVEDNLLIDDLKIEIIETSHDVESVGYIVSSSDKSIVYITDTGYVNKKYYDKLRNKTLYVMESNYDEKMLMNGPYPYILKQRVLSDKGHLSNMKSAKLLVELVGDNTKKVVLAHISENNNTEELALKTTQESFKNNNIDKEVIVAHQLKTIDIIEV